MKEHLGHYEVVSELGRGGMGVVYKGYEPALTRYVAIKELSPALAHDHNLVERFLREARSMASLSDPHIIQVYFIGQENNQPFFAMEFVEGESLSQLIKREGRIPAADVLKILLQTAHGLQTAHERGVIHRDIKPANLMLDLRGRIKIADFGIALARQEFDAKLTGTGEFVGTPGYLSPEICLGKPVDARSDLFALGIVMFECLSGRLPFSDESPLKLMLDVVQAEIPDIREINREVDADTARILTRLVAKDPGDRYQSAADVVAELEQHPLLAGKSTQLGLQIRKPSGAASTMYSAPPTTPTAKRKPTPPPIVGGGTGAGAANPEPPLVPGQAPPFASAPSAAATPARPHAAPQKASKAPLIVAIAVVCLVLGTAALGGLLYFSGGLGGEESAVETLAANSETGAAAGAPATADSGGETPPPTDTGTTAVKGGPPESTGAVVGDGTGSTNAAALAAAAAAALLASNEARAAEEDNSGAARAGDGSSNSAARTAVEETAGPTAREKRGAARAATRVAVVGSGDPAIISPVVQALEERAASAGWQISENSAGADRVIRVNFDQTGTQQLQFYGRSTEMVIGQLTVRAFGPAGRALGPGFRSRIEYTALNADAKAEEAIRARLDSVVGSPGGE